MDNLNDYYDSQLKEYRLSIVVNSAAQAGGATILKILMFISVPIL